MKKISIIDDDSLVSKMLEVRLQQRGGYEIRRAFDGVEGLRLIEEFKPDLIILDLAMPKKNGFEVLQEMQSQKEKYQGPYILILSNLSGAEDKERALNLGGHIYFLKTNITLNEVVEHVAGQI